QLKEKLFKEGLFEEVNKKAIPKYASRIGVITSPTGAAIRDIVNVSTRRYPCVNLILYPTLVQGPDASKELVKAIEYFDITDSVDVIIIGRGGGSIEDLWAFNDEELARAIYKCHIPVISGVGHEIDFTICDYVSDVRAATPSAAAEIATPDIREIINTLENFSFRAQNSFIGRLNDYKYLLNKLRSSKVFAKPENMLDIPKMRLDSIGENLISAMKTIQGRERERFAEINAKLAMLNPMAVIARGYGAIFNSNGKIIKSINDTIEKDLITIKVSDGEIKATVNSREEDDNNG
ncbi:MAG: exodeoxyribonuclease VII large subunit, partial [Clostridia bacterium]|nr:exodeoxyribonuclease VII large subunit [Clostridia bacterium]